MDESSRHPEGHGHQGRRPRKERWLARHVRHGREIWNDPRSAGNLLRDGLIGIWRARGGGFYGLGYLITFVILEARMAIGQIEGSDSVLGFVGGQLVDYVLRLGFMSVVNVLLAFLWPLFVLQHLAAWGALLLVVGYFGFERWLRPVVEASVPELRKDPER